MRRDGRRACLQRVEGFQAVLATAAGAGGRGKRRLQFAAQYLPAAREGRAPPYFATIALDAPAPPPPTQHHQHHQHHSSASASSCCATHATTSAAVASSSPAPPHTPEAALHAPAGVAKAAAARYRVPREGQVRFHGCALWGFLYSPTHYAPKGELKQATKARSNK